MNVFKKTSDVDQPETAEERREEQETVCHHAERLANGECEVCEDNSVRDYWLHRTGEGFYIQ